MWRLLWLSWTRWDRGGSCVDFGSFGAKAPRSSRLSLVVGTREQIEMMMMGFELYVFHTLKRPQTPNSIYTSFTTMMMSLETCLESERKVDDDGQQEHSDKGGRAVPIVVVCCFSVPTHSYISASAGREGEGQT